MRQSDKKTLAFEYEFSLTSSDACVKFDVDSFSAQQPKSHFNFNVAATLTVPIQIDITVYQEDNICDALQQKVLYGPCYKLLVWYKYHSVISVYLRLCIGLHADLRI